GHEVELRVAGAPVAREHAVTERGEVLRGALLGLTPEQRAVGHRRLLGGARGGRSAGRTGRGGRTGGACHRGALFLDARRLALEVAQVVEARLADAAAAHDVDLLDGRSVRGEDAFHPDAVRHLADGESRALAAAAATDDDPLEDLDALLLALADVDVDRDGVPHSEIGDVALGLAVF